MALNALRDRLERASWEPFLRDWREPPQRALWDRRRVSFSGVPPRRICGKPRPRAFWDVRLGTAPARREFSREFFVHTICYEKHQVLKAKKIH